MKYKNIYNCYSIENKISYICRKEYNYFLNKKNVIGLGLGYKFKKGFYTDKKCIKVFVAKKIQNVRLNNNDIIPNIYKGIQTDVVQSGNIVIQSLTKKIRPVLCGYSIGPSVKSKSGTIGCLVTDGFSRFLLSNNHVIANNNKLPLNTPIIQPSIEHKGKPHEDIIANLTKFIPIKFSSLLKKEENYVDCAVARLTDKSIAVPKIALIGSGIKGINQPKLGESVKKVGEISELTNGKITSVNTTFTISYGAFSNALFKNQIATTGMSQPGDSGAILLDDNQHALGLLVGGSEICTVFNNIHDVLRLLSVEIIYE